MRQDDYLACGQYQEQGVPSADGISTFQNADTGKFYFSWLDENGNVIMRSEGYPAEGARDNGVASVLKNRELEARYSVEEVDGQYFVILKAGNHQEIAKSCACSSEADALALFPAARAKAKEDARLAAIAAANLSSAVQYDSEDDDYIKCDFYKGHTEAPHADIRTFQHTDGEYYFAVVQNNDDNDLVFRSEGYPATAPRDNGWKSVLKNRDLTERYSTKELGGHKFVILKAGNHKEIARSCPLKDDASLWGLFPLLAPVGIAGAAALGSVSLPEVSLPETDINVGGIAAGGAALAGAAALANAELPSIDAPEISLPEVDVPEISVPEVAAPVVSGFAPEIVPDEIEEEGIGALPIVGALGAAGLAGAAALGSGVKADIPVVPVAGYGAGSMGGATTVTAPVAATGGGLGWLKWALPLLAVAAGLWWLSQQKGCNPFAAANVDAPSANVDGSANANGGLNANGNSGEAPAVADTVDASNDTMDVSTQAVQGLSLDHIFFDYAKANLRPASITELDKLTKILQTNTNYTAHLKAYTDADGEPEANKILSQRRLDSAKAYLISKGITENRIQGETFGETNPVAKNELESGADTEEGRQLNRRVEIYVLDGSGADTGASKAIKVDEALKQ